MKVKTTEAPIRRYSQPLTSLTRSMKRMRTGILSMSMRPYLELIMTAGWRQGPAATAPQLIFSARNRIAQQFSDLKYEPELTVSCWGHRHYWQNNTMALRCRALWMSVCWLVAQFKVDWDLYHQSAAALVLPRMKKLFYSKIHSSKWKHIFVVIAGGAQISSQRSSSSRPVCCRLLLPIYIPAEQTAGLNMGREDGLSQDNKVIKAINVICKLIICNQN